ncbi:hypothetical protein FA592_06240 [Sulfurospirillum diekertiae]|uniref:hypothetical protein n=1 Tax=Sulfurospirillum diekertiae TaxID=1854492 RepID=UPI00142791EE|nr:hypothetical protein [Sulfurospirillum diekertiae]QIR78492.1 hypothetical protein FA592_06240 [Sulfurospirillum diekertiae]
MEHPNLLQSIVVKENFTPDKFLFINPSLFTKEKDQKMLMKSISSLDHVGWEDVVLFITANSSSKNVSVILTEEGIHTSNGGFLAFSEIESVRSSWFFKTITFNGKTYSLQQLSASNVVLLASIIKKYIDAKSSALDINIDQQELINKAKEFNQHKMPLWKSYCF